MAFYNEDSNQHSDGSDSIISIPLKKVIYRTVFQFEVLSETPIESMTLNEMAEETTDGSMSGAFLDNLVHNETLTGLDAVAAVNRQGSSSEFFMMDENGNELD